MIQQRDILLVPFPFSDQSGNKVRPVVVISKDRFNKQSGGIIVIAVTSIIKTDAYSIPISTKDVEEGILHDRCCIKVESVIKLDKNLIIKKVGRIKQQKFNKILEIFKTIIFN